MIEAKKMIKRGQEQAVASWINYLNQVRLDRLMEVLQKEELNLNEAMSTIGETLKTISRDIVNNGKGRGGQYGMHGFIAEVAECGIGNAREQIEGKAPIYEWINDNGPEDLRRGATLIQQKFVNGGGHLSLQAIRMHLNAYPDFLDNGGVYQIPEDHYEKIKWLLSISERGAVVYESNVPLIPLVLLGYFTIQYSPFIVIPSLSPAFPPYVPFLSFGIYGFKS